MTAYALSRLRRVREKLRVEAVPIRARERSSGSSFRMLALQWTWLREVAFRCRRRPPRVVFEQLLLCCVAGG